MNLSATQVTDPALAERVEVLLGENLQVNLVLELTEGVLLVDDAVTIAECVTHFVIHVDGGVLKVGHAKRSVLFSREQFE